MKIILAHGEEALFDKNQFEAALAAISADEKNDSLTRVELEQMAFRVEKQCEALGGAVSAEEIRRMIQDELNAGGHRQLAQNFFKTQDPFSL